MTAIIAIAEGVELSVLRQAVAEGRLPWFSRACSAGQLWPMACGPAPYEASNLATAFTGLGRGHHGCYSYWAIRGEHGTAPAILTSADLGVKPFWSWPQLGDLRTGVVNVQLTHPPQPINGFILSYLMQQSLRHTYPHQLSHQLHKRGLRYGHDVSVFYRGEPPEHFFSEVMRVARYQLETAISLAGDCDLLIVNMTVVDRLSHFLWDALEHWNGSSPAPFLWRAYEFIDEALARLDALAGEEPMLVFSEEGFGPLDGFVSLDRCLQEAALLRLDEHGEVCEATSNAREAVQGSHGVRLLGSAVGSLAAAQEVRQCLEEARSPDGSLVVARTWLREEIYDGPRVGLAPEIIVEPADPRRPPLGDPRWARHVNRHLQTGWHRDTGFVLVQRVRPLLPADRTAALESIAPTALALMGRDHETGPTGPTATPLAIRDSMC